MARGTDDCLPLELPLPLAIIGHAIVSTDGKIAAADGAMPPALRNDADWQRFQHHLDRSALVVLGRVGHHNHPNPGRRRLVVTSSVTDLSPDPAGSTAMFWNPAGLAFPTALAALGIAEGTVAIAGVFDLFIPYYTGFDLAEHHDLLLRDGLPCFAHLHPRLALAHAGLAPRHWEMLDPQGPVSLTRWSRD